MSSSQATQVIFNHLNLPPHDASIKWEWIKCLMHPTIRISKRDEEKERERSEVSFEKEINNITLKTIKNNF